VQQPRGVPRIAQFNNNATVQLAYFQVGGIFKAQWFAANSQGLITARLQP
jgi:hypothetical protein